MNKYDIKKSDTSESLFFTRLKILAGSQGKSINQIEKELHYPRNALNNYKKHSIPSAIRVYELAEYFGISVDYFFREDLGRTHVEEIFSKLPFEEKRKMYDVSKLWFSYNNFTDLK